MLCSVFVFGCLNQFLSLCILKENNNLFKEFIFFISSEFIKKTFMVIFDNKSLNNFFSIFTWAFLYVPLILSVSYLPSVHHSHDHYFRPFDPETHKL